MLTGGFRPDHAGHRIQARPARIFAIRRRTFNQSLLAAALQFGFGVRGAAAGRPGSAAARTGLTADSTRLISNIV